MKYALLAFCLLSLGAGCTASPIQQIAEEEIIPKGIDAPDDGLDAALEELDLVDEEDAAGGY